MKRIALDGATWSIEAFGAVSQAPAPVRGRAFVARVPGCVHSDLIRAGAIGHPNLSFNEEACQWIGRTDWRYRCVVNVDAEVLAHDRVDLVLDGLDTVAVIQVNRLRAGEAMNMHHAHRFSVKPLLRAGENELTIDLRGPVSYAEEQERLLGKRPVNGDWMPYCYVRKMASNFQWDWGPRIATCGIWRGARLEAWNGARLASVRPIVRQARDRQAIVEVHVGIETVDGACDSITADVSVGSSRSSIHASAFVDGEASMMMAMADADLWWPRGVGRQALHPMRVRMLSGSDILDQWSASIGLREARLLTSGDECGSELTVEINGRPIFCKGANWIPEGLFPEDQSPQRIRQRVQQAVDANFNMLRVWGGGTYEQEAFYDACDEQGIMVWQDFMFACATYPEDDPYPQMIEREAREAIARLAHHPSIVLWCGGNENVLGYESWGWKQRMPRDQEWGERYFFDILPRVVKEFDPSRPYWPDSPHSSAIRDAALHPNDPDHGDRHTWDAKVEGYRDLVPRFCSEFGHQSPPCWATMRDTWGEDQLRIDSSAMSHRQRATGGNDMWYGRDVLGHRFREPRDFDEWLYLAHLLQARAMSTGIEWLRANRPRCMGALFWQFNDAWAGHSWSCIDSAGRCKPAWHAIRRSFARRLLTIQPFDGEMRMCAVNDEDQAWESLMRVRRMNIDGRTLAEHVQTIIAPAAGVGISDDLARVLGRAVDERTEFIVAEANGDDLGVDRAHWFFANDREFALPQARIESSVRTKADGLELTLRAGSLVRDAVLAVDRVNDLATVSDNLITLLPGESRTLTIKGDTALGDVPAARWIEPPVFRCANEFTNHER